MANRLARESSPYLLQHAENPVDWYPWGPEALARARAEDRPILLSIGYSACHWCHVMAHESFEDTAIAALMNQRFINIKVDREERPDLDDVYQHANQLLGGQGGWPLTMFLTPAGVPFFGGTYFPPTPRHGLPAFSKLLEGIAEAYRDRRAEVETSGRQLVGALESLTAPPSPGEPTAEGWEAAVKRLMGRIDERFGGFGGAPKFPNTLALEVLLRHAARTDDRPAAAAVRQALEAMGHGGLFDQIGGGFHRYSVDARWAVPHFEKMLYDNALLASLYLAASQWLGNEPFSEVVQGTFRQLGRMVGPQFQLFSSEDADSAPPENPLGHKEEGAFFVWTPAQVAAVVGEAAAPALCASLGIGAPGNFEGGPASVPSRRGVPPGEAIAQLYAARERRPHPARDEKALAGWIGLALSAYARAEQLLGRQDGVAVRVAGFVRGRLLVADEDQGKPLDLRRTFLSSTSEIRGFSEDYALLAVGFLDLYETDFEPEHLALARRLVEALLERFFVPEKAAFAVSANDAEPLVHRPLSLYDNAIPSATSAGLEALQRLAWLTGEPRYAAAAERIVRGQFEAMVQNPFGFGNLLCGLDRHLRGAVEVVIVGEPSEDGTFELLRAVRETYLPNRALVAFAPGQPPVGIDPALWQGREQAKVPTAYVCRARVCKAPVTSPEALRAALLEARQASS